MPRQQRDRHGATGFRAAGHRGVAGTTRRPGDAKSLLAERDDGASSYGRGSVSDFAQKWNQLASGWNPVNWTEMPASAWASLSRSEERRVGKEGICGRSRYREQI